VDWWCQARGLIRGALYVGLAQADVATALALSQAAVSQLEVGRRSPRVDELASLSSLLSRDVDYFLIPMRKEPQVLGMTFRAAMAELPLPALQDALSHFIDEIETQPYPGAELVIEATEPKAAAQETLEKSGQDAVPVNVKAIAVRLGVGLFFRPFPDALSAFLLRGDGRSVIGVNSTQSPAATLLGCSRVWPLRIAPRRRQRLRLRGSRDLRR
jgi:transcriptional regulator with XRE-family HTH domain